MKNMTNVIAIITLVLMPAAVMANGIDFSATENGSSRPSWGRAAGASWGMSGFLIESGNKFTAPAGAVSITSAAGGTFDPIAGYGATNADFLGYQVSGPGGTRLIFDRLAAQIVTHVLGGDTDEQITKAPDLHDRFGFYRPQVSGGFSAGGSGQSSSDLGIPEIPTPTPTPEPTSAALMGLAAWMIGLRRPNRIRQA